MQPHVSLIYEMNERKKHIKILFVYEEIINKSLQLW